MCNLVGEFDRVHYPLPLAFESTPNPGYTMLEFILAHFWTFTSLWCKFDLCLLYIELYWPISVFIPSSEALKRSIRRLRKQVVDRSAQELEPSSDKDRYIFKVVVLIIIVEVVAVIVVVVSGSCSSSSST